MRPERINVKRFRYVVFGALAASVLLCLFPPWIDRLDENGLQRIVDRGHAFVGARPQAAWITAEEPPVSVARIDLTRLVLLMLAIWITAALIIHTVHSGMFGLGLQKSYHDERERLAGEPSGLHEPITMSATAAPAIGVSSVVVRSSETLEQHTTAKSVHGGSVSSDNVNADVLSCAGGIHPVLADLAVIAADYINRRVSEERFRSEMKLKFGAGIEPYLSEAFILGKTHSNTDSSKER